MPPERAHLLRELYVSHHGWLRDSLRRRLGCEDKARDIAHDTFIKAFVSQSLAVLQEPRAFLSTLAHGLVVSHWRRLELERAYLAALEAGAAGKAGSPEEHLVTLESLTEIEGLLRDMPAKAARAFLMHQLEGKTHLEIAAELGVSDRMVKKYMAQVMHRLLQADV